jgi:molybdopterin synthase sulfur carrier subunit
MNIPIKYFGLIADITCINEEVFFVEKSDFNTTELLEKLYKKYKYLKDISFVIAVNKSIIANEVKLNPNDTIALLPPFAGG